MSDPAVHRLCTIDGTFFRAVDQNYVDMALLGSHRAGRYSRSDQRTLYLSSSRAGIEAAMLAHRSATDPAKSVLSVHVQAENIFDLRDIEASALVRNIVGEPFADWQEDVARGREPLSWKARDWIEAQGAQGLIDPSRKAPGLWHLVLFRWNTKGAPRVRL